jgi:TolB-like protein/DNA-binding winged helix-turn-helix (wHTH) protein/Tfp pilus assembly protein PilF
VVVASGLVRIQNAIRFGEDFELDFQSYKLQRAGRVLKLERIPMEILFFLIEQKAQLVTRDQIVEKVWGKGVFLDTDNSINGAIRKIRQVLKDDPEQPRFIQTITGQGYRFIAPVIEPLIEPGAESLPAGTKAAEAEPVEAAHSPLHRLHRHKKFGLPVAALCLLLIFLIAASVAYLPRSGSRPPSQGFAERTMLAILPFQNLTGDSSQEYFSDGLTEEMITQLGNLDSQHLGVIARTSVMHYKNSQTPLDQIGRELGVQYVLEGSVRRDSATVRITAQLIQMKDQSHVWAREYDRVPRSLLVVQGEIAQEIAGEIQLKLNPNDKRTVAAFQPILSPAALEAYDLYLKGQYFWNKRTPEGLRQAIDYFQQAIQKDPTDARAYAALADSYALISGYSGSIPPKDVMPKAHEAAMRALELDEGLAEAHAALAVIAQDYDWDWKTAEKEYLRAIALNPNYATAHHWYGEYLALQGRFDEGFREIEHARQLDPLSLIIGADNCVILYYARQYDRSIEQCRAVLQMEPGFPRAHGVIGAYVEKGLYADAVADAHQSQRIRAEDAAWTWAWLAYVYGRSGQNRQAQLALEKLKHLSQHSKVDPSILLLAYVGMGMKDEALSCLEEAYAAHSIGLASLKVSPAYDPLRSDPRFQDVLRRMGLTQ